MFRAYPFLLAALLIAAAPVPAPGPIPVPTLAVDAEQHWLPYTLTPGNQLLFAATVDGRPVTALLDTGASQSMLSDDFARRTARQVRPRGAATAIGGIVPLGWTAVDRIAFGPLVRRGGGLAVVRLPGSVTGNAAAIDLLVGRDLLDRFALELDPAGRRFRLLPSGRLPFRGTTVPLRIGREPPAYVAAATIAGRNVRPLIVDTGDGTALTLARDVWRTLPLATPPAVTTQLAYGAGGQVVADIAILPTIALGDRRVDDVAVWVEASGGFSQRSGIAGRIGMGLLQRYRVLLDPAAGHLVLGDLPTGAPPTPPRSTSGLQLGLVRDRLRVLHVMRGSPAARDGWVAGDTICAVDGRAIADDPLAAARADWPTGAPGRVVVLRACDGRDRTLTLARFY